MDEPSTASPSDKTPLIAAPEAKTLPQPNEGAAENSATTRQRKLKPSHADALKANEAFLEQVARGELAFIPGHGDNTVKVDDYTYALLGHIAHQFGGNRARKEVLTIIACHFVRTVSGSHVATQNDLAMLTRGMQFAAHNIALAVMNLCEFHQPLSGTVALSAELELSLMDMALWVPVAQRYSFLPSEIVVRDRMPPEQRALALQGLSNLIAQVTEAVCFALGTSLGLPRKDLLNDLLICHDRACKLAVAWENILRKLEATAYQARAHGDVLTERLLVTAT